jgi:large subunit ribosomal protein L4
MMELKLIDQQGQSTAKVTAPDALFGRAYNEALVHQVVTAYLANARLATRSQKDRGTVKHSTKKPWRQKGTGRARAGMTSSPLWRGGGRIFPNTPDENYGQKVNRKMYRAGVCSILSQLAREGRLAVVDSFTVDAPKTRLLWQKVRDMGFEDVLIITDSVDENLKLSSRNLPNVNVVEARHADPVSLIRHANVLLTKSAMAKFEELLK